MNLKSKDYSEKRRQIAIELWKNPKFREKMLKIRAGNHFGKKHWNWHGGIWHFDGRIYLYTPKHPYSNKNYVLRSRLVMEKHLGRFLLPTEKVHHINGVKDDDRLENLLLCSNQSEHMKIHRGHHYS